MQVRVISDNDLMHWEEDSQDIPVKCIVETPGSWNAWLLKCAIASRVDVPPGRQRLFFERSKLNDEQLLFPLASPEQRAGQGFMTVSVFYSDEMYEDGPEPKSSPQADEVLPDDAWTRIDSRSHPGHYYYFNSSTGSTQWHPPLVKGMTDLHPRKTC